MTFRRALAGARADDPDSLDELARTAISEGEEEAALERIRPAAEQLRSPLLWQWTGLLHRSLDEHERAIDAFARAAELAPNDAGIAHGRARVALEAGLDCVDLFIRARALAPADGAVLLGLTAARNACGEGVQAADELRSLLQQVPGWIAGHEALAQLVSTLGRRDEAAASLEAALARFPHQEELWLALFSIEMRREDFLALERDIARARAAGVRPEALRFFDAVCAGELSDEAFPAPLFEDAPPELASGLAVWRIRHLLRVGEPGAALPLIDDALAARNVDIWPYAATAWRLTGDERSSWLEGDPRLVQVLDLTKQLPSLGKLADALRGLHIARGEYLDQSVRGGTQTDGPLFCRSEPIIRQLRGAVVAAIEQYLSALPPIDEAHPLLSHRRDRRVRFAGSWSVRLRGSGRHENHVHPQGWISSALYLSLPGRAVGERADAGWFTLGEPPENLGVNIAPWKKIEPIEGRLVLFPSWMWHGTVPFNEGERLTVAFDVRPPI